MIHLNGVTDEPYAFGSRQPLLAGADLDIPVGRYACSRPRPSCIARSSTCSAAVRRARVRQA